MPSHITVVPASTQAGKETIRALLASEAKPFVRAIYRDPSKAPAEFTKQPNFEAAGGDVGAGTGLDFSNSEAVLYVPPPTYDGTDHGQFATEAAHNIKNALKEAPSVKRLVLHSAVGAQHNYGIGVLRLNHISDRILKEAVPEVHIVKPGYYFETWAASLKALQASDSPIFESPLPTAEYQIPMVSAKDVGDYCANALLDTSTGPALRTASLFGPHLYNSLDFKEAIEAVLGKSIQLKLISKEGLAEFWAQQVPRAYVHEFVDLITALLPGGVSTGDFKYDENTARGKVELVDALRLMLLE
ncbi:hypothetical protein ACJ41O_013177 [Fusarium nematophilum]